MPSKTTFYPINVEYAKSNRSTCGRCNYVIDSGAFRVIEVETTFRRLYYDRTAPKKVTAHGIQKWYVHLACHQPKLDQVGIKFYNLKDMKAAGKKELQDFLEGLKETNGVNLNAQPVDRSKLDPDLDAATFKKREKPDWVLGGKELAKLVAKTKESSEEEDEDEEEEEEQKPAKKRKITKEETKVKATKKTNPSKGRK